MCSGVFAWCKRVTPGWIVLIRLLRRESERVKLYFAKLVYVCVIEAIKILLGWQSNFEKRGVFVC